MEVLQKSADWLMKDELGRWTALVLVLFWILGWGRILARAGFPSILSLLMLVPPLGFALFAFVAFAPWPLRREVHALRRVQRVMHQAEKRRLAG